MRENIPSVKNLIGAVFFLATLPAQVNALTPDQVFDKVRDSIVLVKTLDVQGKVKGQGSGVLLPSGKIATNCHVVEGGASYQVGRGKELVRATLYAEDGDKDICLLNAKGITGKPAQLGKASDLKVGVPVYAVGAPQGLELSLSNGIVAQLRGGPPPVIQTTAAISAGSSGGGLFDGEGRLVGLTTLYMDSGQSLNFAMPVEWISDVKPGRKIVIKGHSHAEWYKHSMALMEAKNWQGLLDWCQKWTKSEPREITAWYSLGIACDNLQRYDDAIDAYRQTLRINADNYFAWTAIGDIYSNLQRYDEAISAYDQALRIDTKHTPARYNLMEVYRQIVLMNPEDAKAWTNLGAAYNSLARYNDAIDASRQALSINPENAGAWFNLGIAYSALKRGDNAIDAYRQVLRINAENAYAWNNLGIQYSLLKRYNDAIDAYRQVLRINPEMAGTWGMLVLAYYRSGNRTAAMDALRELRRLDPQEADMVFNLIVPR